MSAPNTDPKKDRKRHKGPLTGMTAVVIFALVLLAGLAIYVTMRGNEPGNEQPIGADRAGEIEQAEPGSSGANEAAPAVEDEAE